MNGTFNGVPYGTVAVRPPLAAPRHDNRLPKSGKKRGRGLLTNSGDGGNGDVFTIGFKFRRKGACSSAADLCIAKGACVYGVEDAQQTCCPTLPLAPARLTFRYRECAHGVTSKLPNAVR